MRAAIPPIAATFRLDVNGDFAREEYRLLVTSLDEELDIGIHERSRHRDVRSVRHDSILVRPLHLDTIVSSTKSRSGARLQAEDVIPSTAVQTRRVLPQFIQNLLHLEGSGKRLDQNGSSDATLLKSQFARRKTEHVVP